MRIIWTLIKVMIGLAIAIPLGIFALALTVGVVGAVLSLAIVALKIACIGLIGYGAFRVARLMFGSPKKAPAPQIPDLTSPTDAYYEAAVRELDAELGRAARG
jgi:hypothetical protein